MLTIRACIAFQSRLSVNGLFRRVKIAIILDEIPCFGYQFGGANRASDEQRFCIGEWEGLQSTVYSLQSGSVVAFQASAAYTADAFSLPGYFPCAFGYYAVRNDAIPKIYFVPVAFAACHDRSFRTEE